MPDAFMPWTVQLAGAETADAKQGRKFAGIAATVGTTDDARDYQFAPGAFDDAVRQAKKGRWPVMLFMHGMGSFFGGPLDDQMPVGVWQTIGVEGEGASQKLTVEGELAETARGNDLAALLRMAPRPAIDGLSIGFTPSKIKINEKPKDGEKRVTFQSVEIHEISLVTMPAMGAARVKSVQAEGVTKRTIERVLVRDAGLTRSQALALMRGGYDALAEELLLRSGTQRDAGECDDLAALIRANINLIKGIH